MLHVVIVWCVLIGVIIVVTVVDATDVAVCVACNVDYVAGYE